MGGYQGEVRSTRPAAVPPLCWACITAFASAVVITAAFSAFAAANACTTVASTANAFSTFADAFADAWTRLPWREFQYMHLLVPVASTRVQSMRTRVPQAV